jgi:hypothetical protein
VANIDSAAPDGSVEHLSTRHGWLWNLWFDLAWSSGDYRLRDPAGLAAWRQFCNS